MQEEKVDYLWTKCFTKKKIVEEICLECGKLYETDLEQLDFRRKIVRKAFKCRAGGEWRI